MHTSASPLPPSLLLEGLALGPPAPAQERPAPLSAVPFDAVAVEDPFWDPLLDTSRRATVAACPWSVARRPAATGALG